MDPISQGITGSLAGMIVSSIDKRRLLLLCVLGFFSGMSADLDVLIRSSEDPLLGLEYHRQFTHSLVFIPFGGLLCALLVQWRVKHYLSFKQTYLVCTLGYATHCLLDACTTYGTLLFWPFSDHRVAFHIISIIDPLYTLPLIVLVILACIRKSRKYVYIAITWAIVYFSIGTIQHQRAIAHLEELVKGRGHSSVTLSVKPSFANLVLWKTVYLHDGYFYVDAVHLLYKAKHINGEKIRKFELDKDFPGLPLNSLAAKDIKRFNWFSHGYTAIRPNNPNFVVDVRYSLLPNQAKALWGIKVPENSDRHVEFVTLRNVNQQQRADFISMLFRKIP